MLFENKPTFPQQQGENLTGLKRIVTLFYRFKQNKKKLFRILTPRIIENGII